MTEPNETGAANTIASERLLAGQESRFRILRCIGSGGMGDVHLAEDSKLRRLVAIKTIRSDLCKDEEIRKRIERECLLHAKIGAHPHIVTLFDRLEEGDRINLVMEYVEGDTLQHLLEQTANQGKRLAWKDGIDVACQCLDALSRIHAQGIVHRDIKPSNILITRDDSEGYCAKLMDFGIARPQNDDEQSMMLTKEGAGGPGTPIYMAPEQIDPATFGPVSFATDVYAMGVMLYQIVSGKPPFTGSLTEIFNGHLNSPPPPPDLRVDPTIPPAIITIINRALAKKQSARFPSARVFRDELERLIHAVGPSTAAEFDRTLPAARSDPNKTMAAVDLEAAGHERHATLLDTGKAGPGRKKMPGAVLFIIGAATTLAIAAAAAMGYFWLSRGKTEAPPQQTTQEKTVDTTDETPAEVARTIPAAEETTASPPDLSTAALSAGTGVQAEQTGTASAPPEAPALTGLPSMDTAAATSDQTDSADSDGSIMDIFDQRRQQSLSAEQSQSGGAAGTTQTTQGGGKPQQPAPPPKPKETTPPPPAQQPPAAEQKPESKPEVQQDTGWKVIRKEDHKIN